MRNVTHTDAERSNDASMLKEGLDREDQNAELNWNELENVVGGRFTNIRANATSLIGSILTSSTFTQ